MPAIQRTNKTGRLAATRFWFVWRARKDDSRYALVLRTSDQLVRRRKVNILNQLIGWPALSRHYAENR